MPVNAVGSPTPVSFPSVPFAPPSPDRRTTQPTRLDSFSSTVARPDPLAVRNADGVTFKPVDLSNVAAGRDQALAVGADVPGRVQDGPTCGLTRSGW